jgi:hypothetical protein
MHGINGCLRINNLKIQLATAASKKNKFKKNEKIIKGRNEKTNGRACC